MTGTAKSPSSTASAAAAAAASPADEICYRCKAIGHRAKDCPTKTKAATAAASAAASASPHLHSHHQQSLPSSTSSSISPVSHKRVRETSDAPAPAPAAAAPSGSDAATLCYRCKATGHMAKDCPTKQKRQKTEADAVWPSSSSPSSSASFSSAAAPAVSSNRLCYVCKSPSHLSAACPDKDRPRASSASGSASSPAAAAVRTVKPCYRCHSTAHTTINCTEPKACFYCSSAAHLAADCPDRRRLLHEQNRSVAKACHRCGSTEHTQRVCPSIPHRPVFCNEQKDRSLACYVCGAADHHAVECPLLPELEADFAALQREGGAAAVGADRCNSLLERCAAALEYRGAVWLHSRMQAEAVQTQDRGWAALVRLHDVSGRDQSRLQLPGLTRVQARRAKQLLSSIVAQHLHDGRQQSALSRLQTAQRCLQRQLKEGQGGLGKNVFAVCRLLRVGMQEGEAAVSAKESRELVMLMLKQGVIRQGKQGIEWADTGGDRGKAEAHGGKDAARPEAAKAKVAVKKQERKSSSRLKLREEQSMAAENESLT